MTVEAQTPRNAYTYSGTGTPYPVTFTFIDDADLGVVHTSSAGVNTTLTLTSQYTVAGGAGSTGTITVTDATLDTATGSKLTIYSALGIEQQTDLVDGAAFLPSVLEIQFDRNVRVMQQMQEEIDRSVKTGITDTTTPDELLSAIDQAVIDTAASEAAAALTSASAASSAADAETARIAAEVAQVAAEEAAGSISLPIPISSGGTGQTNAVAALTALGGEPAFAKSTGFNKDFATEAQAVQGVAEDVVMSPLRVAEAIAALTSSTVTQIASRRSTLGTWTITGVVIGKPMYINISNDVGTDDHSCQMRVISGSNDGQTYDATSIFGINANATVSARTPWGMVLIPTATTVEISIISGSDFYVRAYQ